MAGMNDDAELSINFLTIAGIVLVVVFAIVGLITSGGGQFGGMIKAIRFASDASDDRDDQIEELTTP